MTFRSLCLAAIVTTVAAPISAQTPSGSVERPTVMTVGQATDQVAPDVAWVQVAAEGRAPTTAAAQKLAADGMTSVQGALKALSLGADAVRTTGYQLQPEYDYVNGRQVFRDYLARNTIEARVDDLTRLPAVIDAAGTSGASLVSGLRFDVKGRAALERTLLERAVADALARATSIANGAHQTLGPIVRIDEQRIGGPAALQVNFRAGVGGGGGAATPISPGEIQVQAQVVLTVQLK